MGNLLSQCQHVSLQQCELCTEGLPHWSQRRQRPQRTESAAACSSGGSISGHHYPDYYVSQPSTHANTAPGIGRSATADHTTGGDIDFAALQEALWMSQMAMPPDWRGVPAPPQEDQEMAEAIRAAQVEESRERASLLQEQNREYEESLRIDRQKAEEKRQKQLEEEERFRSEERKTQEEEHARELAAKEEAARQERVAVLIKEASCRLHKEPSDSDGACSTLRIRTPAGKALKRAFNNADPVGQVYDYCIVEGEESLVLRNFRLIQTMPRQVFENRAETLSEAGLTGQCALLVEIIHPSEPSDKPDP